MTPGGLPHSGIRGSTPADGYPRLIAAFHALLRLVAPRHPPCALNSSAPRDTPCRANRIVLYQPYPYALVNVHGWSRLCVGDRQFRGSSPRTEPASPNLPSPHWGEG